MGQAALELSVPADLDVGNQLDVPQHLRACSVLHHGTAELELLCFRIGAAETRNCAADKGTLRA
jgi:hypothetical protein